MRRIWSQRVMAWILVPSWGSTICLAFTAVPHKGLPTYSRISPSADTEPMYLHMRIALAEGGRDSFFESMKN